MSLASESIHFPPMGKSSPSRQVNMRIDTALYDEAEAFRLAEPYEPTWGKLMERLVKEWVATKRAAAAAKAVPPKSRPKG